MHRTLRKIKFICIKNLVDIYCFINSKKNQKKIAIISCNAWKNKVLEDIKLRYYLAKHNIQSEIVSWEEDFDHSNYDTIIIRSVWGFDYKKFNQWLKNIDKKVKIINNYELINNNFSKKLQYDLLDEYSIKHVDTKYLEFDNDIINNVNKIWKKDYSNFEKIVIKPSISESGNNTYVLSKTDLVKNSIKLEELENKFNSVDSILMVQPFIEEISKGELSIIAFNNQITHAVVRYPGIFNNTTKVEEVNLDSLPKDLIETTKKILKIKEYSRNAYMRIDFVRFKDEYVVLEIELIDPILFINNIKDKKRRKLIYSKFVAEIKKEIS